MQQWELDAALDVLTMCSCHLSRSDPLTNEVRAYLVVKTIYYFSLTYAVDPAFGTDGDLTWY